MQRTTCGEMYSLRFLPLLLGHFGICFNENTWRNLIGDELQKRITNGDQGVALRCLRNPLSSSRTPLQSIENQPDQPVLMDCNRSLQEGAASASSATALRSPLAVCSARFRRQGASSLSSSSLGESSSFPSTAASVASSDAGRQDCSTRWALVPFNHAGAVEDGQDKENIDPELDTCSQPRKKRVTLKLLCADRENCHRQFLIDHIDALESQVAVLQSKTKCLQRKNRALASRLQSGKNCDDHDDDDVEAHLNVTKKNSKTRLTKRGLVALGVRKALATTSALSFPRASLLDTSRQTIVRSEVIVWACLVARMRAFHKLCYKKLSCLESFMRDREAGNAAELASFDHAPDDFTMSEAEYVSRGFGLHGPVQHMSAGAVMTNGAGSWSSISLGGTSFSGDATNSRIWQNCKLQGLMVCSSVLNNESMLAHPTQYRHAFAMATTLNLAFKCQQALRLPMCQFAWALSLFATTHSVFFALCSVPRGNIEHHHNIACCSPAATWCTWGRLSLLEGLSPIGPLVSFWCRFVCSWEG